MYFPYFRGKQFELITIRENAQLMAENGIVPIIEPVKASTSSLKRAVSALMEVNAEFVLISNPQCGDLKNTPEHMVEEIIALCGDYTNFSWGYLIADENDIESVPEGDVTFIHAGSRDGREVVAAVNAFNGNVVRHVFSERSTRRRYRRLFGVVDSVLLNDGFIRKKNREYSTKKEHFSDLHLAYTELNLQGFGDFLIVGEEYLEGGGPAWAVALHLTFLDAGDANDMYIKHYISDRTQSKHDTKGKFFEALAKLVADVEAPGTPIMRTRAVDELVHLQDTQRFPGLGYLKKLSMQHHIEVLADFLGD